VRAFAIPASLERLGLADIVCLTGMSIQGRRMREILEEVRSQGEITVVGGLMATVEEGSIRGTRRRRLRRRSGSNVAGVYARSRLQRDGSL
jgi:hypothetical protein